MSFCNFEWETKGKWIQVFNPVMANPCASTHKWANNFFWKCHEPHVEHGFGYGLLSRCAATQKRLATTGLINQCVLVDKCLHC